MAKLVTGILIGLVVGLYLDHSSAGAGAPVFVQFETVLTNLFQF